MTAQQILSLIENVDPVDTAGMDEIDARVWCYWQGLTYEYNDKYGHGGIVPNTNPVHWLDNAGKEYTRSRDALKSIRPDGWIFYLCNFDLNHTWFQFDAHCPHGEFDGTPPLPTEELAELHAIIQAIDYERNK